VPRACQGREIKQLGAEPLKPKQSIAEILSEHFKKLGKKGGSVSSEKKTLAARLNAKKPRKRTKPEPRKD
jgi:hypothetical protein